MKKFSILVAILAFTFFACQSGPSKTVRRSDGTIEKGASGRWNDKDSSETAKTMIAQMLDEWLASKGGEKPVLTVGKVKNKSSEHIEVETFMKDLQRYLILDKRVKFTASLKGQKDLNKEKERQMDHASDETAKSVGNQTGADFILKGQINTIHDRKGGKITHYYQIELELHNIETAEIEWMGQKKIKKYISQKRRSW